MNEGEERSFVIEQDPVLKGFQDKNEFSLTLASIAFLFFIANS